MNILMLNASPKMGDNNSAYFLEELKNKITPQHNLSEYRLKSHENIHAMIHNILFCDTMIIAFPLYVDSIPSHLLFVLESINKELNNLTHKPINIYGVINCGFYEGIQTNIAMEILKNWCNRLGFIWKQGIGIGAGEMLGQLKTIPLGRGPKKTLGKSLTQLAENIMNGKTADSIYVTPDFPRFAFKIAADNHWKTMAKSFGNKKKDILRHTLD